MIPPQSPAAPILVGREREQAALREALAAATAGRGSLVLIGGEAGIGKTALAEATLRDAGGCGCALLKGHCFDLTETPPYGPFIDLFARYTPMPDDPPLPEAFASRGRVGAIPSQFALVIQVRDFLAALAARRPVALLLDDLHWADAASLDLLRVLARSVAALPLLAMVTYRSDELTRRHPLYTVLPNLAREGSDLRLSLASLDTDAVRALVDARYALSDNDATRLVGYVQRRSEGNALFVGEVLRTLEERRALEPTPGGWRLANLDGGAVPALLRQVIEGRLSRLDAESRRLLAVAAVIGYDVPIDVWAAVGEADEATLFDLVERAEEAHLLAATPDGAGMRFAHALIRETLYEGMPALRRRNTHRRTGEIVAETAFPDPDMVADHFQRAGDVRAVPWLIRAGDRAQAAYAWVIAAARLEAALAHIADEATFDTERGWLLLRIARLLRYADPRKARTFAQGALAVAEASGDRALAAYGHCQAGNLAAMVGDVERGVPQLASGVGAVLALSEDERSRLDARHAYLTGSSRVLGWQGTLMAWQTAIGQLREAWRSGERLLAEQDTDGTTALLGPDGYHALGSICASLGWPERSAAMFARAHEEFTRVGHHRGRGVALWFELVNLKLPYRADRVSERLRHADAMVASLERASEVSPPVSPRGYLPALLIVEGAWAEAWTLLSASVATWTPHHLLGSVAAALTATLARHCGDAERGWHEIRALLPDGAVTVPGTIVNHLAVATAQRAAIGLALDAGDLPLARDWLAAHDRWLDWTGAIQGLSEAHALWAQYWQGACEPGAARARAEQALAHAASPRQPLALLAAHRLLGELDTMQGRLTSARAQLDEALRLADACAAPYERALTLLALTELCVATGEPDKATSLLADARAILEPLGARPALARAAALRFAASPARSAPDTTPRPANALTTREAEVLGLVVRGLTNAEVAERLFLSRRTVTTHLTSIYAKLGVSSRTAAARFANEHGLA